MEETGLETPIKLGSFYVRYIMEIANNMAVLYADKLRKGLCEYEDIPESLRAAVEELLAGGE